MARTPQSSTVSSGTDAKASQYNNLRKDVLDLTLGHQHDGVDSPGLTEDTAFNVAQPRYLPISPSGIVLQTNYTAYTITQSGFKSTDTNQKAGYIAIRLPHGAIITQLTTYWYKDDALATGQASLYRVSHYGVADAMASASPSGTGGDQIAEDTSIDYGKIDNYNYTYCLLISVVPNDGGNDVQFYGGYIIYTISKPLP